MAINFIIPKNINAYDYVVVGSGFLGSVLAENIASTLNKKVLVIEKRSHIGGNCYSEIDTETNIEFHKYGTHIFHTSSQKVWNYLSKFTEFTNYFHKVIASVNNQFFPLPINLKTINSFFKVDLLPEEVEDFIKLKTIKYNRLCNNFEEEALSKIGSELYQTFFKGYTQKQWQINPTELPPAVFNRLPIRYNNNSNYFYDNMQGLPKNGYTQIFTNILSHKNIDVCLNTDFFNLREAINPNAKIIYSGPIDKYFDYKFGKLQWRTLQFVNEIKNVNYFQSASVINYPDVQIPFTRIHEPKHLHPERNYTKDKTLIIKEYSIADDGKNPYYPILTAQNVERLDLYKQLMLATPNVIIAGRLGEYKYYDMDKTIERALQLFEEKLIIK